MVSKKKFSILNFALLVALVTAPKIFIESFKGSPALAQSPAPTTFTLPSTVPKGTTVGVDGSSSMAAVNQALKRQFEERYPGTGVNVGYTGSPEAVQAVADGKLDLAAIGRSLTPEERAKGVTASPVTRSKIAMLVSNDNPFKGSLTIQQFAKIFRGEIKDWSEVGGAPGPIRLIDRPDSSDTREAFRNYPVFREAEFKTGATATKMTEDSTQAIIQQLGKDGISYVTANQLSSLQNVRALMMHNTMPDDPRYPFSQPLSYVYKEGNASPAIAAFLGYATSPDGQKVIDVAQAADPATLSPELRNTILSAGGAAVATTLLASPGAAAAASPSASASPGAAVGAGGSGNGTVAIAPGTNPVAVAPVDPSLPGWLWWLLPLGALGLLAWLLKSKRGTSSVPPAVVVPPTDEAASDEGLAGRTGTIVNSDRAAIAEVNGPAHSIKPRPEEEGPNNSFGNAALMGGAAAAGAAAAGAAAWANRDAEAEPRIEEPVQPAEIETSTPAVDLPDATLSGNLEAPSVEIPTVELPTAELPNVTLPNAGLPNVDLPNPELPNVDLPNPELPNVDLPTVKLPQPEGGLNLGDAALLGGAGLAAGAAGAAWGAGGRQPSSDSPISDAEIAPSIPSAGESVPSVGESVPSAGESVPSAEVSVPNVGESVPSAGESVPSVGESVPSVGESVPNLDVSTTQPSDLGLVDDAALLGGAGLAAGAAAWAARSTSAPSDPEFSSSDLAEEVEAIETQLETEAPSTTFDTIDALSTEESALDADAEGTDELVLEDDSATIIASEAQTSDSAASATGYAAAAGLAGGAMLTGMAFRGAAGVSALTNQEDQADIEASKFDVGQTDLSSEVLATVDEGLAELPDGYGESRIVLLPRDPQWAYAYWDIPNEQRQELRNQGGQHIALRLYDVTDVDLAHQAPHSVQECHCEEMARDWYLPIPVSDRDYVIEIGYPTADGRWLMLARSAAVRIPPVYPSDWQDDQYITMDWQDDLKGKTFAELHPPSTQPTAPANGIYNQLFDMVQGTESMRITGSLFGSMQQVPRESLSSFMTPLGLGMVPTPSGLNVSGLNMSGVGFSASAIPNRPRNFWLVADAELIVYGATEPDAKLTIGGKPVPLNPDGTFRFQLSFQDGMLDYPIVAVAADGEQNREIQLKFTRETPVRRTNTKEDAVDEWFS